MSNLHTYLPQDRLQALRRGEPLPNHTTGTALFADISGFTTLTEALQAELGPRRGAEALTEHLEAVYTAAIAQVEQHGGSVIDFAGDAILCWFDAGKWQIADSGWQPSIGGHQPSVVYTPAISHVLSAIRCALAMQAAMQAFPHLGLKVAIATGPAHRWLVGDPAIHQIDILAGATVARTATGEQLAQKGEVVVDEATAHALGSALTVREWRTAADTSERFAVVTAWHGGAAMAVKAIAAPTLTAEQLRPFILPAVYAREQGAPESFLTEFRPGVAVFVRFTGINYEAEAAATQLDDFLRHLQAIVLAADGTLLHIVIGDKGSYAYIVFGAPTAHEDDARRAVKMALTLRDRASHLRYLQPLQMGVSGGVLRVGVYGGPTRRTYSALGDDTNRAARLMEAAAPGEILLSGEAQRLVAQHFSCELRPALALKSAAKPLTVFALTGERKDRAIRLQEPHYAAPMVGRQTELQTIGTKLDLAAQGQIQVVSIVAEAGLGKSRLVAEVIHLARRKGFQGYGGACQSNGTSAPYLAWKDVWLAFFAVDPERSLGEQVQHLENQLLAYAPDRTHALPLLGPLLQLALPDNDFTQTLEPQYRKSALHALLEDCLRAAARTAPLLLVIEDLHWVDALSHDLLEELARALAGCAICFVLAYRPPQLQRLQAPRLERLPYFTQIPLTELTPDEGAQIIHAKLAQLYAEHSSIVPHSGPVPPLLIEKLWARAQGNPFYIEELLNFLRDQNLNPHDSAALENIALPDSLHTLILSRIDQLTEHEKTTLRVASIIGRLFRVAWLTGYYPALGDLPQVKNDLDELHKLDITPLDTPEPDLTYLFKHIITHEVTYESLSFATRAQLHEQLAHYLESIAAPVAIIAQHYAHSQNPAKQREYFQKAGEAAEVAYANSAALDSYTRLLPLLTEPNAQLELHLKRGKIFAHVGEWAAATADYQAALNLASGQAQGRAQVRCELALGELADERGDFQLAQRWAAQALAGAEALADITLQAAAAHNLGRAYRYAGDLAQAEAYAKWAFTLIQGTDELKIAANALCCLGDVALDRKAYGLARPKFEEGVRLARQLNDKFLLGRILDHLGTCLHREGNYALAQACFTEQLTLSREIGHKFLTAYALMRMGGLAKERGLLTQAQHLYEQVLDVTRALGTKRGMVEGDLAELYVSQGHYTTAQHLLEEAATLFRETNRSEALAVATGQLGFLALATQHWEAAHAHFAASLALGQRSSGTQATLNMGRGLLAACQGQGAEALRLGQEALETIRQAGVALHTAINLCHMGFIACQQSDFGQAQRCYLESLQLIWASEYRGYHWARAWAGLARVVALGAPQRGVQWAAFAEQLFGNMGAVLWPLERVPLTEAIVSARLQLGEALYHAAWATGAGLTIEAALQYVRVAEGG